MSERVHRNGGAGYLSIRMAKHQVDHATAALPSNVQEDASSNKRKVGTKQELPAEGAVTQEQAKVHCMSQEAKLSLINSVLEQFGAARSINI